MQISIIDPWDNKTETLTLRKTKYADGNPALLLEDSHGSPYAKLSVNVPGTPLKENQYVIKDYSENENIVKQLINQGILVLVMEETGHSGMRPVVIQSGFVQMAVYRLVEKP